MTGPRIIHDAPERRVSCVDDKEGRGVFVVSVNPCDDTPQCSLIPWEAFEALRFDLALREADRRDRAAP